VSRYSIIPVVLLLSSCATQPAVRAPDSPGFLMGLLHGFFVVLSLIGSIWWDMRVYAFPNSGGWYDLGFVIGAAMFFGAAGRESERYYAVGYEEGFAAGKERGKKSN
jgi:hypothetical protein